MKVTAEIEVKTEYSGIQKINDVKIWMELDEHKREGWKVEGICGLYHYLIGCYRDRREAVAAFAKVQCRLLLAQEKEAETRK